MTGKYGSDSGRDMTNLLFTLLLLCAFAVMALIVVMTGADAYKRISADMSANSDLRIPLSYVASKVRQGDQAGAVSVVPREDTSALVIESSDGDADYETWIYEYDGRLCEVTVEEGAGFELRDGIAILPVSEFRVDADESGLLTVTAGDQAGRTLELQLELRSGAPFDSASKS